MCHDLDSLPPIPVVSGAAVSHDDLELTSADGTRFAAFAATPDEPNGSGVVVLPDVRGLYRFYEELALRLAERGYAAVAIDYFGRTAGVGKRGEDFDWRPHVQQTSAGQIRDDVAAAVELLRSPEGGESRAVFTVGFCFGGRHSWLAAEDHGLAGAIGFYGMPGEIPLGSSPAPIERASAFEAPILALMGGDDPHIPAAAVADFERALAAAGVDHEVVTYDGAPHSFFDRAHEQFAEASEDAWRRVLSFMERNAS